MAPSDELWIYFGFLSHWALVSSLTYQLSVLLCSTKPSQLAYVREDGTPGHFLRFIWVSYPLATSLQILVTLLYWVLVYDPSKDSPSYVGVSKHGVIAALLLFDGFLVGRIPIRLKHFLYFEFVLIVFVLWSVIYAFSGWGKFRADEQDQDDSLYDVLKWRASPVRSVTILFIVLLVAAPVVYGIVWMLSIYSGCCKFNGGRRRTRDSI